MPTLNDIVDSTGKGGRKGTGVVPTDADYQKAMAGVQKRLESINGELTSGRISVDTWAEKMDAVLLDGHETALRMGFARAGQFDLDDKRITELARGIKDTESEFLFGYTDPEGNWHRGFVGDLKSGDDSRYFDENGDLRPGSLDSRSDLYTGRMRGTANEAFVEGSDDGVEFDWELGATEHCEDCLEMSSGSPYSKDTLFSYPGDGGTQCLGRCDCRLVREDGVKGFANHNSGEDDGDAGGAGNAPVDTTNPAGPGKQSPGGGSGGSVPPTPPSQPPGAPAAPDPDDYDETGLAPQRSIGESLTPKGPEIGNLLKESLAAIDEAMLVRDVDADRYLVHAEPLPDGTLGAANSPEFNRRRRKLPDGSIYVDPNQGLDEQHGTLIHEIGHAVDYLIPGHGESFADKYSDESASRQAQSGIGLLVNWWKAIQSSQMYKDIEALRPLYASDPQILNHLSYLLSPSECWARCFTQYTATKSKAFEAGEWKQVASEAVLPWQTEKVHWALDDFEAISKEVDEILRAKKWKPKTSKPKSKH